MELEKKIGCMQGCLTAVGIFIAAMFGVLILISFSIKGCVSEINKGDGNAAINKNRPVDEKGFKYREQWSAGVNSQDAAKVVRIRLSGVITRELTGSVFSGGVDAASAIGARNRIRAAKYDKDVKAIILEIILRAAKLRCRTLFGMNLRSLSHLRQTVWYLLTLWIWHVQADIMLQLPQIIFMRCPLR